MPYSYPNDVPDRIKELPAGAQKIWISTFNSAIENNDEATSNKIAWSQVKTQYKKNENGNWVKKTLEETKMKPDNNSKQSEGNYMSKDIIKNNTSDKGFFKTYIPLKLDDDNKVGVFEKQVGDKTVKYLRGEATNTKVDKEDDIMSKEFIDKMKNSIIGMNVFAEHEHSIEKTLGYIDEVSGDNESMILDTSLEDEEYNDLVDKILKKIDHGTKIAYSIGGKITKAVKYFDKKLGKTVRKILDGEIYEASLTAFPAGNVDMVAPIQKSLDEWINFINEKSSVTNKSNTFVSDKGNLSEDKETTSEDVQKVLEEMAEQEGVYDQIYDLMWSFRRAVRDIVENEELTPEGKKNKIINLGTEFGVKIEELSARFADLENRIAEQMQNEE